MNLTSFERSFVKEVYDLTQNSDTFNHEEFLKQSAETIKKLSNEH
jgi:hypothetical protein